MFDNDDPKPPAEAADDFADLIPVIVPAAAAATATDTTAESPQRRGGFQKGQSGNPSGRPRGLTPAGRLREAIGAHVPAIVAKLAEQAKAGDTAAAKVLLDRVSPPLKPVQAPVPVPALAGIGPNASPVNVARAVLTAAGEGSLSLDDAVTVLGGAASLSKLIEVGELAARVAALEASRDGPKSGARGSTDAGGMP